jgi:hypothetical protein
LQIIKDLLIIFHPRERAGGSGDFVQKRFNN